MTKRAAKKGKTLTKFVCFSIVILLLYTVIEFVVSTVTGISHDQLTTGIFSSFGGELFFCCILKALKIRKTDVE